MSKAGKFSKFLVQPLGYFPYRLASYFGQKLPSLVDDPGDPGGGAAGPECVLGRYRWSLSRMLALPGRRWPWRWR